MVAVLERARPFVEKTQDTRSWTEKIQARVKARDALLAAHTRIVTPELSKLSVPLKFYSSVANYTASVDRSVFENAGVSWPTIDALWDKSDPSGYVPEHDRVKNLNVGLSKFTEAIGSIDTNVYVVLNMNASGPVFEEEIRAYDETREFGNPILVEQAKVSLGQELGMFQDRGGHWHRRYGSTHDYNDRKNILVDLQEARALQRVIKKIVDQGNLQPISQKPQQKFYSNFHRR